MIRRNFLQIMMITWLLMSQFHAYRTWLDEGAHIGAVLAAIMEDVDFFHDRYEPTRQSTYHAAIRQEQLLQQGDTIVDYFLDQLFVI
jgi:hypothetical protein